MTKQEFIKIFRDADWINRDRIQLWATCFAVTWFLFLFWDAWAHSTLGITDAKGERLGRDFIYFWASAVMAAKGKALAVYNVKEFLAFEQSLAGPLSAFTIFSYPPVAILLTLPLALFSFLAGYAVWCVSGYALCAKMLSRYVSWRLALVVTLAAPACFLNLQSGQNGFFTAALLAGGLSLLDRRPVIAGILFGLLCYKPQLGIVLPLALVAGGYWRSFFAAGATVAGLILLTALLFGFAIWPNFIEQLGRHSMLIENGYWYRMQSVFCGARIMGAGVTLSYGLQAVSSICALVCLFKTWRGPATANVKNAVLVLAVFLATPYAWDYDMVVCVFAALWIIEDSKENGWRPWEKFAWCLLILMPLPLSVFAKGTGVQLNFVLTWVVMAMTLCRAKVFLRK